MRKVTRVALVLASMLASVLALLVWRTQGAHASRDPAPAPVVVRYLMWDAEQVGPYRQCAEDFMARHPDIRIRITQVGWGDYWTRLSTGFIAGTAPDVFVNHLQHAPQYMRHGLLEDLGPLAQAASLDLQEMPPNLMRAWQKDGRLLGMPKDWDTVALIVNLDHAKRQGVTLGDLQAMEWNPQDGGSFEQVVRRLTVDVHGRNALDPQFDRHQVAVHGFQPAGPGGLAGQTEWSAWAASNGFVVQREPWQALRLSDPRLADTVQWLADLPSRGLSAPAATVRSLGAGAMFASGRAAMLVDGAWMSTYYARTTRWPTVWVRLPAGPGGVRASMLNGTADSLWIGSRVKAQAWQWIAHMASVDCQRRVARTGVVFPSRLPLAEEVLAAHRARGIDSSAFVQAAQGHTFLTPIVEEGARIDDVVRTAMESVHLGQRRAAQALEEADRRVQRLSVGRP